MVEYKESSSGKFKNLDILLTICCILLNKQTETRHAVGGSVSSVATGSRQLVNKPGQDTRLGIVTAGGLDPQVNMCSP